MNILCLLYSFSFLERNTFKLLYNGLVRSHLEFAVCVWCPTSKGDIEIIEKVQKRATRMVKSVRNFPYEERLKKLGMIRLENRRVRSELIQMFKIMNGSENINLTNGINFSSANNRNLRREHDRRLVKEIVKRGSYRYNFITNRVVNYWNDLPREAAYEKSVNSFKAIVDREVFGIVKRKDC